MWWSSLMTFIGCSDKQNKIKPPSDGIANFDDAIAFTGFGIFNILIMAFAIPASVASIYDTTTMSYVITSAECDLELSLVRKGILNAMTHIGMISCAFISGYITDTLGRRKTLIFGYLLDACCNLISVFSVNFYMLAVLKFITGFLMCGPCTVILSCLSEFFSKNMRPVMVMYVGMCFSLGSFTIPFIAWMTLENAIDYKITTNFVLHSWQIFMAVCSIPSVLSGILALALPESPRFLAAMGKSEESIKILKRVYAINTGNDPDTYPIKQLYIVSDDNENDDDKKENVKTIKIDCKNDDIENKKKHSSYAKGGVNQLKTLLCPPHLGPMLLMFLIEYGCITGCTLRLWLPQLFKMMSESDGNSHSLCEMIALKNNESILEVIIPEDGCKPIPINSETFENAATVAGIQVIFCLIASFAIGFVGKKNLLVSCLLIAGICCSTLHLCTSAKQATILAAIVVTFSAISSNATISALVDLIPTNLRATAASCALMIGRIGAIVGNMVFPILLSLGCLPAFLSLGCLLLGCSMISLLVPKPKNDVS